MPGGIPNPLDGIARLDRDCVRRKVDSASRADVDRDRGSVRVWNEKRDGDDKETNSERSFHNRIPLRGCAGA
jgi:hypothetical protein